MLGGKIFMKAKSKGTALALLAAASVVGMTMSANATEAKVTVPATGTKSQSVTARFIIGKDTLIDLSYGTVVSIPITVPLSYKNVTKIFEGSKRVYGSGIIASGKKVTVSLNGSDGTLSGLIDSEANYYNIKGKEGFAVTFSKTEWNQAEMADTFQRKKTIGICPNCGKPVVKGRFGACYEGKCGIRLSYACGKELTEVQLESLLAGKKTHVPGLKSSKGMDYDVYLTVTGIEQYSPKTKNSEKKEGTWLTFFIEIPKKKKAGSKPKGSKKGR